QRYRQIDESDAPQRGDRAHAAVDRGAVSINAQHWRHHHGHQSARECAEQVSAELGLPQPIRGRRECVSAQRLVQSDRTGWRARLLDRRCGQEICEESRPAGGSMKLVTLTAALLLAATRLASADGDAARGEKRFEECAACHALEKGKESVGPDLHGVFGRKAGEAAAFRYSPALKRSGIVWSEATVDTFIADPQAVVPGNRMPFAGIPDAPARADLIAYLVKTFK